MKRMMAVFLVFILCLSLPTITGFAERPEVKQNQLYLFINDEENELMGMNTGSKEPFDEFDTNVAKFTVGNMIPGEQQKANWAMSNETTFSCYLDLESITVTNNENTCLEPEIEAGDDTPNIGELQNAVNLRLFIDKDTDGCWSANDVMIYDGITGGIAGSYDQNELIEAGDDIQIVALFDWLGTPNDNQAMGDDMELSVTFELSQSTDQ